MITNSLDIKKVLYPKKLGEFIRQRRKLKEMNQYELAALAGTKQNYVSMIEHGHEQPSIDWIVRVADALGMKDNPGMFFNALAGRLDENGLLKNAKVVQLPEDFAPDEMAELEDYLKFILWRRANGSKPFLPPPFKNRLQALNEPQLDAMLKMAEAFEGNSLGLEEFIKLLKNQRSNNSSPVNDED